MRSIVDAMLGLSQKTGFMKYSQRDHKKRVKPRSSTEGKQSESDDFFLSFYFILVLFLFLLFIF